MDIAALSSAMATDKVQTGVAVAMVSKANDVAEQKGADLIKLMESSSVIENSITPHIGSNVDVKL